MHTKPLNHALLHRLILTSPTANKSSNSTLLQKHGLRRLFEISTQTNKKGVLHLKQ